MSSISNFFNSINYCLSKKSEPVFNNYGKIITNFTELTPKTTDAFDMSARERYISGPTADGRFICTKMTQQEIDSYWAEFVTACNNMGIPVQSRYKWDYNSMACNSYNQFRIDIYSPGRIVVKSTLPKYGWCAPWIYCSQNAGDYVKPWLLPIDKSPSGPREYYFEIDMFENFLDSMQRISFSGHYGTQTARKMNTRSVLGKFDTGLHFTEIVWDGKGNWTWLLNSVVVFKSFIPFPEEKIYPYFMLTMGLADTLPPSTPIEWKVDYVKFSNVVML